MHGGATPIRAIGRLTVCAVGQAMATPRTQTHWPGNSAPQVTFWLRSMNGGRGSRASRATDPHVSPAFTPCTPVQYTVMACGGGGGGGTGTRRRSRSPPWPRRQQ